MSIDNHRLGISELRSAFSKGTLTPTHYVTGLLSRIDRLNPRLRAFIEVDRDGALAAAVESERRYKSDKQRPLEGVAIGIKANIAVAGLELNAGMAARTGMVAENDASVVADLRAAGMVILGTLNMHEAALGATTDNAEFGRCLNPHGEGRTPGGSSGGSGAAVAAGLCTVALGTDTLGSIRIPAAYCGIFGLKPTNGSVSNDGIVPCCDGLDVVGPLARSMDDLSALSNMMFTPDLSTAMQRARFHTLTDFGGVEADPDVLKAYQFALSLLPQAPEPITLPSDCKRIRTAGFVRSARALAVHLVELGPKRCERISKDLARLLDFGISREDHLMHEDRSILDRVRLELREALGSNGILVLPTAPQVAFPQGSRAPVNQADWTGLANIAGLPAISIPIGRSRDLMPIGAQMIGPPGSEALLVAQARALNDRLKAYAPPNDWW
jgi:aspartyl-tRNA(Asn)/glutamyl-tRNA(Gln) amidotransferase subunit A